jgi:hypothetical protein
MLVGRTNTKKERRLNFKVIVSPSPVPLFFNISLVVAYIISFLRRYANFYYLQAPFFFFYRDRRSIGYTLVYSIIQFKKKEQHLNQRPINIFLPQITVRFPSSNFN